MFKDARSSFLNLFVFIAIAIGLILIVSAAAPMWANEINLGNELNKTSYFLEDTSFIYNFTANVTDADGDPLVFSLSTGGGSEPIIWGQDPTKTKSYFSWIFWQDTLDRTSNSSLGILVFNATLNNQTGRFNISVDVSDGTQGAGARQFYFIINATNDAPNFTNIQTEYNLTQAENFIDYLNATDEEGQYPLVFNITFFGNCTHASWSNRNEGENCTILNAMNFTNVSAIMNFTPSRDDVGTYWANISVMDFGNSSQYGCPHEYCTPDTYNLNQTTIYSSVVRFNVFSALAVNISDCQNKIFQENESGACQINITTKQQTDDLNISSLAILRNYIGGVLNSSWFLSNTSITSENFSTSININFTPQKTEIGNWTINISVYDFTTGENKNETIYVIVNRSVDLNEVPDLLPINDITTSIDLLNTISLTVYDADLEIPHKDSDYGGYNETLTFNVTILNSSDLSQELNLTGFDVDIISMPVLSNNIPTNKTTARIQFTPNSSEKGNYTINLTVTDGNGAMDVETFNITILSNNFPYWTSPIKTIYNISEDTNFYFNVSSNVTDDDGDTLTFSYTNDTSFSGFVFNLTSGIINFTPTDIDVGQHLINITVNDSYLVNTTLFVFNVNNTNDAPVIEPLQGSGATVNVVTSNTNTTEDVNSTLILFISDEDFKIPDNQKSFYNESLTVNLTIQGPNINLFEFNFNQFMSSNRTKYLANFAPNKSDVGSYNVSINVSDVGGLSDFISFNLTIASTEHAPNLTSISNYVSSVEDLVYVNFNATDSEDGADTLGNLRFFLNFTSGENFVGTNESIFNTTSGILNYSFNSSQSGIYEINVSVNDTTGRIDSFLWNITVYDYPVILSPIPSFVFSMKENVTYTMNFSINHTIQDNLNYKLYINGVLRNTTTGNGNATDFLWDFTTNFTDETTCSGNVNITLNVSNAKLSNTTFWSLQVNHTNYPLRFLGSLILGADYNLGGIDNKETGTGTVTFDLDSHFFDIDATDSCVNQTIGFATTFLNGSSSITSSIINWTNGTSPSITYTNSLTTSQAANYSLIAYEYNISNNLQVINTVSANNFTIQINPPSTTTITTPTSSSGGGGGRTTETPISLKIIVPDPISSKRKDKLVLPITLINTGKVALNNIFLQASVAKDGLARKDLVASFDSSIINLLSVGDEKNLTLIVDANTEEYGLFEITINASVETPSYNDWAKIFINVEETEDILERIIFTEEFVAENPECIELTELVDEARNFLNAGAIDESYKKLDEAIEACRIAIEQPPSIKIRNQFEKYIFNYVWIISIVLFILGFVYYSFRRRKLKKGLEDMNMTFENSYGKEKFNNKKNL